MDQSPEQQRNAALDAVAAVLSGAAKATADKALAKAEFNAALDKYFPSSVVRIA